ncbi:T9SS type B sorting domain-containing protein, partial [Flavobacterium branchiarum]
NMSTDNCSIDTMVLDKMTFNCTNIGTNTITLTVTDVNGNSASGTAVVTVEDKINPIVLTKNITVQLDATGNATITPAAIDNVSSDNCGIATFDLDIKTFDCSNIGPNTVTLTVTDVNGNAASETAVVTVEDNINPIVLTKNITVQLDATGNATITPAEIDNVSSDNCAISSIDLDIKTFDCSNIGPNTVRLTVTDVNGNAATETAVVTIEDNINPIVLTKNITVQLDATGNATITPAAIDNVSSDNCGIATMDLNIKTFNCSNIGPNTVTLTVTDVNGNAASETAVVTVEDKIDPTVLTKNITVQLDATGNATITPAEIDNLSSDNCAILSIDLDIKTFDCSNIGPNTVTLTVTDVNGNTASETAVVTVEDNINPIVLTKNITVQLDATGNATITPAEIDNVSSDNCAISSIDLDIKTFDCSNIGPNTVTLTVTDVNGNAASETAVVTIEDKINPIVLTKNSTVQLDATGNATITPAEIDNVSSDNCGIATFDLDIKTFDCSNIGLNTVTLTVTDVNGNAATETAVVTIEDKIDPIVITQNITVQLNATGNATITPAAIDNVSSDNCGIATFDLDIKTFDCSNIGPNTITLTVTDVNGNAASETAVVTVEDNINPIVLTKNITVQLDATGNATITPAAIDNVSSDNCGIASMDLNIKTFNCSNIGPNTVTLTVTDVNGNTASETAVVTVEDKIDPTVLTKNITVQLDATGNATITPAEIDNLSTDNCRIDKLELDKTTFDCTNIGDNTVTLTVTDVNGNTATQTAVVTIEDKIKPTVITQNITVQLNASGTAVITSALIDNGSNDACTIDSIILDKTSFTCSDIGPNTVTLTVTDVNGNTASGVAVVTVEDKIKPTVITQDITISLSTIGTVSITANQIDNGSTDNCGIDKKELDKMIFDCTNIGINTVILTITDLNGNSEIGTAVVTILPVPEPIIPSLSQEFCSIDAPSIRDIDINDATNVKWFTDATSTQTLSLNASISNGIYYAATAYGNCYSNRIPVQISIKDAPAPTGNEIQYMCKEKETVITDLITNEQEVLWYTTATGGSPLSSTTILEDNNKYYASYIGSECESTKRLEVTVHVRYCDVSVNNGISANGDGKNDYFFVEGATTFPDNKLEIFNSWGGLVFEANRYGYNDNLFKGYGNKGVGSGAGLLPYGTYYYVFSFTNHDNKRITKKGFLHLNP